MQPPNSSVFFSFSSAVIPESQVARIEKLPGVDEVAPVFVIVDTTTLGVIYGIDYDRFNGLSSGFTFLSGGAFSGPRRRHCRRSGGQGAEARSGQHGFLDEPELPRVRDRGSRQRRPFFVPIQKAQEIAGAEQRVSLIYVRSTGDTGAVLGELNKLLPGYRIRSMAEYMSLMTSSNLPELRPFLRSFIGLGIVISFLVVLLTMYTMVLERRREIGILKAIGSSRLEICWLILAEALMLVGLGVIVGLSGTYATTAGPRRLCKSPFPPTASSLRSIRASLSSAHSPAPPIRHFERRKTIQSIASLMNNSARPRGRKLRRKRTDGS